MVVAGLAMMSLSDLADKLEGHDPEAGKLERAARDDPKRIAYIVGGRELHEDATSYHTALVLATKQALADPDQAVCAISEGKILTAFRLMSQARAFRTLQIVPAPGFHIIAVAFSD